MHYLIEFKNQFYSGVTDSTIRMLQSGKKKLNLKKKNCAVLEKDLAKSCILMYQKCTKYTAPSS